jgi:acetylornithine deacetylase
MTELVEVAPGRPNVLARRGQGRLLFCTHLDTVPPFIGARRAADRIYGRGACDTKGALACMVEAARRLIDEGLEDLAFLLVVGEEVDHVGARATKGLGLVAESIILGEPTELSLMRAQKGILKLRLTATGRAAHSGYPEHGESAIEHLLTALERLRAMPLARDPLLGPSYLNVGTLGGGLAANVVAPSAEAGVLFRTVSDGNELLAEVERAIGDLVAIEVEALTNPVHLRVIAGYPTAVAGFATDAPYISDIGPVVLAGPGSILDAHTAEEHITFAQLAGGVDLYAGIARKLAAGTPLEG